MAENHSTGTLSTGSLSTGTEATPPSEHGGGFPPFQKDAFASQLLWLAIFFVALYLIASKLALPRVGSIIADRRKRISGDLDEAARMKDAADAAIASYEKALADARARAQTIAATRTAAMTNVQGIAQEAAIAIVARLTGKAPSQAAAAAAVKAAINR